MLLPRLTLRSSGWLLLGLVLAAGCRPQDEIARYTVPKPELIDPTLVKAETGERQILGAIVIVDRAGWFFKLTGAKDQIGPLAKQFITFVEDLKFEGTPAEPKWTVPPGWKEQPGNEFRFATLTIPTGGKAQELTVSTLELGDVNMQDFILANVNRWRGQIGLGDLKASDLATETITTKVGDYPCTLVNMLGTGSGAMPRGPFAGGGGPFASGGAPPLGPSAPDNSAAPGTPKYTKPAGWTEGELNQFRKAAFNVSEGDKKLLITLIDLPPSPLLANVQRWGAETGMGPIAESDVPKLMKKIDVGGEPCDYVELVGPASAEKQTTVLGVIVPRGNVYSFVKLKGDSDLAQREKANFESFVKSLKFE
jgi:hypothetical protein